MATTFNNALSPGLGLTETNVLTSASNERITVIGLSLSNLTDSVILANIRIVNNLTSASAYFIKNIPVPPNQSLRVINGGEKLILTHDMTMYISASQNTSLDLVMSYVTIV